MDSTDLYELIKLLRGPTLTVRTGLWVAPPSLLGQEVDEAARLGIDAIDLRQPILASLPPGTRFLGLNITSLVSAFDSICRQPDGSDCMLVYNVDLLMAKLGHPAHLDVWRYLFRGIPHRSRSLLLFMPRTANHLLPSHQDQDAWRQERRLVE